MAPATADGEIVAEFARMRIGNPLLDEAHSLFDNLRYVGRRCSVGPLPWGGVFGPPLTGKTMSVTTYIESSVVDELIRHRKFAADMDREEIARQQRTVVPVIVSPQATERSFAVDILQALGGPLPPRGLSAQELLALACVSLRDHSTELLIIEEAQHLLDQMTFRASASRAETTATKILKTLLLKGVAPVVLVGNMEARYELMSNVALATRCIKHLDFGALDRVDEVQWGTFINFVGTLGARLKQHGLFDEPSDFVSGDVVACIHEVANGRLGMASAIICSASMVARKAGAVRVTREHLSIATDTWAVPVGIIDYNPFEDGIRSAACSRAAGLLGAVRRKRRPVARRHSERLGDERRYDH
ncbi:AAA family ATPase [Mesorhizobium sp. SP-1A]|uniref:AAA family ATPase n=1 Tax=Mesorhizobium sp. SP-1A TaxID=3077840 RepID=UPI0028F70073|nr:AAA family ATPase [Mesorhizobium sp. SP-1A]